MLKIEPGKESEWAYWAASLAVNRAVMAAIDKASELPYEPELARRPFPVSLRPPKRDLCAGKQPKLRTREALS